MPFIGTGLHMSLPTFYGKSEVTARAIMLISEMIDEIMNFIAMQNPPIF
jgi:hypothetical protein